MLAKQPDDRTLIHSVSYELTTYLCDALRGIDRPVLTYKSATERVKALEKFRKTPAAILVAPSMDRGVDLPGDDARCVIIVKVPFMSTKDKQVERRLHTHAGDLWYKVQAVRGILQMSGRGMRSADDFCIDVDFGLPNSATTCGNRAGVCSLSSWIDRHGLVGGI